MFSSVGITVHAHAFIIYAGLCIISQNGKRILMTMAVLSTLAAAAGMHIHVIILVAILATCLMNYNDVTKTTIL